MLSVHKLQKQMSWGLLFGWGFLTLSACRFTKFFAVNSSQRDGQEENYRKHIFAYIFLLSLFKKKMAFLLFPLLSQF